MSSESTAAHMTPDSGAAHRQRFGLIVSVVLGLIAGLVSYLGTRDAWVSASSKPKDEPGADSAVAADPALDIELPLGRSRDEFQIACLTCHSARLPLGQPTFRAEKWAEIVHKMVTVYGAPMTPIEESRVVDYLVGTRPRDP